jgi:hypothetical protein
MTYGYSYHRIVRKVVVAFGNLFNGINLSRYDEAGTEKEKFLVPIVYGGKEKYVSRLEGDPNLDKKVQITLPMMSFELVNMKYDAARKLNTNKKITYSSGEQNSTLAVYNPVPFDFEFELIAYVRNIEDGAQLMEKILPYFTPDYTISVNLIPEMGISKQMPIILNDVANTIEYEGEYDSKVRIIMWTINFTVKGYLYGPITEPKIIRTSITNILDDNRLKDNFFKIGLEDGFGNYKYDEYVYQGYSFDTNTWNAKVQDWNSSSNTLTIKSFSGNFVTGQNVIGQITNASWSANTIDYTPNTTVRVTVTPNPSNVILPNNYTYTTVVSEFPNIV